MKKLIMLYGFAASGKTTLAKKFIHENPLTIAIERDQIIGMIGQWRKNEDQAKKLAFEHVKSIATNHLRAGNNVIIPYLLNETEHSELFERTANENYATFIEVYLDIEKDDAVNRLIGRGCWGEEGSRKLTEADRLELENRFDYMVNVMKGRKKIISIQSQKGDVEETFKNLLDAVKRDC